MTAPTPREQMTRMISGYWISQTLYVAAKLGIADQLKEGPRDAETLAKATGCQTNALYRLLRALASVGVFREEDGKRFALTPTADMLRSDAPESLRPLALMMGEEHYWAYGHLLDSVRTGATAFALVHGKPLFDYLAERPEQAAVFDAAMTAIHGRETAAMLDACDFSSLRVLADVGGGNGSTLCGILERHPALQGILVDLPHVVERARPRIEAAGVAPRCRIVGGSFFEAVPAGADAYLLRHIIHDWDDENAVSILRQVRHAMSDAARVLVVESVIPPGNEPSFAKLLDLTMMVSPGGMERTEEEYRLLFEQSGLRLTRIVPTSADVCVIEGVKS